MTKDDPRDVLKLLPTPRLITLARGFGLKVDPNDTRSDKSNLIEDLARSENITREGILKALTLKELKNFCRTYGLPDEGSQKAAVIDRLLGKKATDVRHGLEAGQGEHDKTLTTAKAEAQVEKAEPKIPDGHTREAEQLSMGWTPEPTFCPRSHEAERETKPPPKRSEGIPSPFLIARVHEHHLQPAITGLCVGYEANAWRARQFADHLMEWLPDFALDRKELETLTGGNLVQRARHAAAIVYQTDKFQKRGEFGEIILHAAVRQICHSVPAISKIIYKSATNDTVKGFDAVHVVEAHDRLELWLGESKFYSDYMDAVRDVVTELLEHTRNDYLRTEFMLITKKIDKSWKHATELEKLLDPNVSLDQVFTRIRIPILLTYNSDCIASYRRCTPEYESAFSREIQAHYQKFNHAKSSVLPEQLHLHLFLLPLEQKTALVAELHRKLKTWQNI